MSQFQFPIEKDNSTTIAAVVLIIVIIGGCIFATGMFDNEDYGGQEQYCGPGQTSC